MMMIDDDAMMAMPTIHLINYCGYNHIHVTIRDSHALCYAKVKFLCMMTLPKNLYCHVQHFSPATAFNICQITLPVIIKTHYISTKFLNATDMRMS